MERRKEPRRDSGVSMTITPSEGSTIRMLVDAENITEDGMKVAIPRMLIPENDVLIELNLPNCPYEMKWTGQVRWSNPQKDHPGIYECGIKFLIFSKKDKEFLKEYISAIIKEVPAKLQKNPPKSGITSGGREEARPAANPFPNISHDWHILIAVIVGSGIFAIITLYILQKLVSRLGIPGIHY
ncbi:MAG: PilZ domain-containing protein [Candidatus Omnitrophica bacterium]|nr:PilZ domain-containing protein [Candidatus Omnitrophota bacterium]